MAGAKDGPQVIASHELELLISGALSQAGNAIESAAGRRLTRTETERLGEVLATAMTLVADRCRQTAAKLPVPPPRPQARAVHFNPLLTQELPRVTQEALDAAIKARQK
jgi:hypothetical protein